MEYGDETTRLTRTIAGTQTLMMVELQENPIFHTPVEERFERITRLARRHLRVRIAGITLLDKDKEWFKSIAGWAVSELPFDHSLRARIGGLDEPCIVPDMSQDERFEDHPLVVRKPKLRFYASYPLLDAHGTPVATFCLLDIAPRELSQEDYQAFTDFGAMAQQELLTDQRNSAVTDLISKLGSARRASMIDPLTKVWNRAGADMLLQSLLNYDTAKGRIFTICLLDIDGFKQVNDNFGHPSGDEVLRKLAARFVRCLRPNDIVCRYGGDEFLMILPDAPPPEAGRIVERLRKAALDKPIRTRRGDVAAAVSIGYATTSPTPGLGSYHDIIEQVDEALLAAKRAGRNRSQRAAVAVG